MERYTCLPAGRDDHRCLSALICAFKSVPICVKKMKIVFFGTAEFACPILEKLVKQGYKVLAVVTQPDRPKGRHLSISEPPIKVLSNKLGLNVVQPNNLDDDKFIERLKNLQADVFIVVSFGVILKKRILSLPKKICINVHASVLPKYRGAAPINWAIIKGETKTGVSIIKMDEAIDTGEIILQEAIEIKKEDNAITLGEKLYLLGEGCLIKALELIREDKFILTPQDNKQASFSPKLKKNDGLINWNKSAQNLFNQIRGLVPWPVAFTYYQGKLLKIHRAEVVVGHQKISLPAGQAGASGDQHVCPAGRDKPGKIVEVSKEGLKVTTPRDFLLIKELQLEGGKRMTAADFIRGHKITVGQVLG